MPKTTNSLSVLEAKGLVRCLFPPGDEKYDVGYQIVGSTLTSHQPAADVDFIIHEDSEAGRHLRTELQSWEKGKYYEESYKKSVYYQFLPHPRILGTQDEKLYPHSFNVTLNAIFLNSYEYGRWDWARRATELQPDFMYGLDKDSRCRTWEWLLSLTQVMR